LASQPGPPAVRLGGRNVAAQVPVHTRTPSLRTRRGTAAYPARCLRRAPVRMVGIHVGEFCGPWHFRPSINTRTRKGNPESTRSARTCRMVSMTRHWSRWYFMRLVCGLMASWRSWMRATCPNGSPKNPWYWISAGGCGRWVPLSSCGNSHFSYPYVCIPTPQIM
jgi:hypothetical protein